MTSRNQSPPKSTLDQRPELILICGPSGGGKSRWAEHIALRSGRNVVYLATGPQLPDDADWQRRLDRHRSRRPSHWQCREVGENLACSLADLRSDQIALVDSLGTWVAAWLNEPEPRWAELCRQLHQARSCCLASLLVVCEEVGWGVVPATPAGHRFRERLTSLEQQLQAEADDIWLVVAHRALELNRLGHPVPWITPGQP